MWMKARDMMRICKEKVYVLHHYHDRALYFSRYLTWRKRLGKYGVDLSTMLGTYEEKVVNINMTDEINSPQWLHHSYAFDTHVIDLYSKYEGERDYTKKMTGHLKTKLYELKELYKANELEHDDYVANKAELEKQLKKLKIDGYSFNDFWRDPEEHPVDMPDVTGKKNMFKRVQVAIAGFGNASNNKDVKADGNNIIIGSKNVDNFVPSPKRPITLSTIEALIDESKK
jgi:hypothetical protein